MTFLIPAPSELPASSPTVPWVGNGTFQIPFTAFVPFEQPQQGAEAAESRDLFVDSD